MITGKKYGMKKVVRNIDHTSSESRGNPEAKDIGV
jgi:hypothetical protein